MHFLRRYWRSRHLHQVREEQEWRPVDDERFTNSPIRNSCRGYRRLALFVYFISQSRNIFVRDIISMSIFCVA